METFDIYGRVTQGNQGKYTTCKVFLSLYPLNFQCQCTQALNDASKKFYLIGPEKDYFNQGILTEGKSQYGSPPHEGSSFCKKVNNVFNIKIS